MLNISAGNDKMKESKNTKLIAHKTCYSFVESVSTSFSSSIGPFR